MIEENQDLKSFLKRVVKDSNDKDAEQQFQMLFKKNNSLALENIKTAIFNFLISGSDTDKDAFFNAVKKLLEENDSPDIDERHAFLNLVFSLFSSHITIAQQFFLYQYLNELRKELSVISQELKTNADELALLNVKILTIDILLASIPAKKSVMRIIDAYFPDENVLGLTKKYREQLSPVKELREIISSIKRKKTEFLNKGEFLDKYLIEKFVGDINAYLTELLDKVNSHFKAHEEISDNINHTIPNIKKSLVEFKAHLATEEQKSEINDVNIFLKIPESVTHFMMFSDKEGQPVCKLFIKHIETAQKVAYHLHTEKGISSRANPLLMKTVQHDKKTEQYFIALTGAQFNLLKYHTDNTVISFTQPETDRIQNYIDKLEESQKNKAKDRGLLNSMSIMLSDIIANNRGLHNHQSKDEKMNAFYLLLQLAKLGYPRQAILDYIASDYNSAINNGEAQKIFDELRSNISTPDRKISFNLT